MMTTYRLFCLVMACCVGVMGQLPTRPPFDPDKPMMYTVMNNKLTNADGVDRFTANVDEVFDGDDEFYTESILDMKAPDQLWGLDASYESGKIYVNSHTLEALYSYDVKTKKVTAELREMTRGLEHIAYDWVTGNLYWTDQDMKAVLVTDSTFTHVRSVFKTAGKPQGLAIDVLKRKLIFSVHEPKTLASTIHISNLDGSGRETLMSTATFVYSIMVHYAEQRIYWTSSDGFFSKLQSCDMSGRDIQTLQSQIASFFYDIAYHGDWIFVTDTKEDTLGKYYTLMIKKQIPKNLVRTYSFEDAYAHNIAYYGPRPEFQNVKIPNECHNNPCQHMCIASASGDHVCKCSYGYTESGNTCHTGVLKDDFLVFTDIGQRRAYQMEIKEYARQVTKYNIVPFEHDTKIYALTVDAATGEVVWYDLENQKMVWGDSRISFMFIAKGVFTIEVDPISKELFWATTDNNIYISNQDGSNRRLLVDNSLNSEVLGVRGIALDLKHRKVYWTELGGAEKTGKVKRMNYDGSDKETVIERLHSPQSIAIDYKSMTIYVGELLSNEIYVIPINEITPNIPSTSRFDRTYSIIDLSPYVDVKNFKLYDLEVAHGFLYLLDSLDSSLTRFSIEGGASTIENYGPDEFFFMSTMAAYSKSFYTKYIQPLGAHRALLPPTTTTPVQSTTMSLDQLMQLWRLMFGG